MKDYVGPLEKIGSACWAVAKLVRHQALDLAFEGSSPSRPAMLWLSIREAWPLLMGQTPGVIAAPGEFKGESKKEV
jgi:hypothetical protein